jgi:integrase/recombinase XerD
VIRTFLNWYVREGYLVASPMRTMRSAKLPKTLIQVLTQVELDTLFVVLEKNKTPIGKRNLTIFSFLLDTGVRGGELVRLRVENLNLKVGGFTMYTTKLWIGTMRMMYTNLRFVSNK